jgi:hypothetical protein
MRIACLVPKATDNTLPEYTSIFLIVFSLQKWLLKSTSIFFSKCITRAVGFQDFFSETKRDNIGACPEPVNNV